LKIIGLPKDVIQLVSVWLRGRFYYVSVEGQNSILLEFLMGTVQGLILGPILYAIFVSPVFDVKFMVAFAGDNYVPKVNCANPSLIKDKEKNT
jgi:hypothetical protein